MSSQHRAHVAGTDIRIDIPRFPPLLIDQCIITTV